MQGVGTRSCNRKEWWLKQVPPVGLGGVNPEQIYVWPPKRGISDDHTAIDWARPVCAVVNVVYG